MFLRNILWVAVLTVSIGFNEIDIVWADDDKKIDELERRINILTEEIDSMKRSGGGDMPEELKGEWGGAPAASKVYKVGEVRTTIGGYGELHYNDFKTGGKANQLDLHRVILYVGHSFNDWIKFNSELEIEHAYISSSQGVVSFEQAYLDFLLSRHLNIRAGLVLVPVGIVNEIHEPPTFHGVERPEVETNIIPTTWRENGAGIFGEIAEGLQYKLYILNGGDISNFSKPEQGARQSRQNGYPAKATDFAYAARFVYSKIPGLNLGGSYYIGDSSQEKDNNYGNSTITLWDIDVQFNRSGFELRGLYADGSISDTEKINISSGKVIGSSLNGWYGEAAYNLFYLFDSNRYMAPFVRYEKYDTHAGVASGYNRDGANDRTTTTVGLTYKPIYNAVIKVDYQFKSNAKDGDKLEDQFNLGIGFMF